MPHLDEADLARIIGRLRESFPQPSVAFREEAAHNIIFDEARGLFVPQEATFTTSDSAATSMPSFSLERLLDTWNQFQEASKDIAKYVALNPFHWEYLKTRYPESCPTDSNEIYGLEVHIDIELDYGRWYVQYPDRREYYPKENKETNE